jgi:ArsR family transcriptional regulator, arsenate/arsenite/antimonite-responsive transcriptional repressor
MKDTTRHTAKLFKALSDQNRIRILKMLEVRPLCVCEITVMLKISTSTASKHLAILRDAGFIIDQKDGKYVEFALNKSEKDEEISRLLSLVEEWLKDDPEVKTYVRRLGKIDRYIVCGI